MADGGLARGGGPQITGLGAVAALAGEPSEPEARGVALDADGIHFRLIEPGGAVGPALVARARGETEAGVRGAQVGGIAREQIPLPSCRPNPIAPSILLVFAEV